MSFHCNEASRPGTASDSLVVMAAHSALPASAGRPSLDVTLKLYDPEVVQELLQRTEGIERDDYMRLALRIGVLALRLAGGQVDEKRLREEGERLVRDVQREMEDYLHPERGRLRVSMASFVEGDRSAVARTITEKLGETSPIFRLLDPKNSDGLKQQLARSVQEIVDAHAQGIKGQLSLDQPESALSRLKRTMEGQVQEMQKSQTAFHTEVREALEGLRSAKKANERGTVHGLEFEAALSEEVARLSQGFGDVAVAAGTTTGVIKNNKTGDIVVTLGAESAAPGVNIVWEAKQAGGVNLKMALDELDEARRNRQAQVGVFVFSAKSAPQGLEPFGRYNNDVVIVWDSEDPAQSLLVRAAYSLARALAMREKQQGADTAKALRAMDEAVQSVARQVEHLGDLKTWAETVQSSGKKIADRAAKMRDDLQVAVGKMDTQLAALRAGEEA